MSTLFKVRPLCPIVKGLSIFTLLMNRKNILLTFLALAIVVIGLRLDSSAVDQQDPIRVGGLLYLTGPIAAFGEFTLNAVTMAVEEINALGGINVTPFEVIIEDHGFDPKRTVSIYQLFNSQGIEFYFLDGIAAANVPPLIRENNHLSMTSSAVFPSHFDNHPQTCRLALTARTYGPAIAEYVASKYENPRVALLSVNNDYGASLEDELGEKIVLLGGEIVASEKYEIAAGDFRTQLTKIQSMKNIDVLVLANISNTVEPMFEQINDLNIEIPLVADVWTALNPALKNISLIEGLVYADYEFSPVPSPTDSDRARNFKNKYRDLYGHDPSPHAANGYDSIHLIAEGLNNAEEQTPAGVAHYLINTLKEYDGAGGYFKFDSDCEVERPVHIRTIRNGERVTLL